MAIVNGQYVPDQVGDPRSLANSYFDGLSRREYKKDFTDYQQAALEIRLKELENQFNLDVWNLNNQYNTPSAQMQRFQDAGLNPNLIYGQQNTASAPSSASAPTIRSTGNQSKRVQRATEAISTMIQTARAARETFDYLEYGKDISRYQAESALFNSGISKEKADQAAIETMWQRYLMGAPLGEDTDRLSNSPRGRMYGFQLDTAEQRFLQLEGIVKMIPDQQARTRVLKQLDDYRLSILKGQNDFVLNINTGLGEGFDSFVKMIMYLVIARLQ